MTSPPVRKVSALITRPGARGPELLCFEHPSAGVQVPAGTVEPGESFDVAARREAWEETGVLGLELVGELGELHTRNEDRHLFHLRATVEMPDNWLVVTPDGGGHAWWCFWAPVDDAHALLHEHQRDWLDATRSALLASAAHDPPPRARAPLPDGVAGDDSWEMFWAPQWPFAVAGRRYRRTWIRGLDDIDICSRARAVCVTDEGLVTIVLNEFGFWEIPGGGREPGETVLDNLTRELWEEARARPIATEFLAALRGVELDHEGAVCAEPTYQAYFWARVDLDPFEQEFEMVERRVMPARDAVDLLLAPNEALFAMAAAVDPLVDWDVDPR